MNETSATLGLAPEQVANLLAAAGRAPSLHNSQPWRFRVTPYLIELHADPERTLPVADPDGRELRIACGAALFNLRLGLHGHGIRPIVTLYPDPDRPDLLAVVRHGGSKNITPAQERLLSAIPRWRTNRHPFSDTEVDAAEQHAMRRAALDEGAWLHVVHDHAQREALREMVARANRVQVSDPAFRAELAAWSNASPERRDGVPASAASSLPEPQDRWVLRDFTAGAGRTRIPGKDYEEEPLIAVLTSHLSGRTADLQVGQALQAVLLTATAAGLATSFLSQVVEVPQIRVELRRLIGASLPPQAVLRIGRGWPVVATPRLRVGDLLVTEPTASK